MQERLQVGIKVWFLVLGALLVALAGRLVYLSGGVERQAAAYGLEVETVHLYPPLLQAGAPAGARPVRVPALTGKSFHLAGEALMGTGLLLEGLGDIRGKVIRQEPAAGRVAAPGTPVRVWLKR